MRRVLSGQSPVAETESLDREDRARELLVLGLRRMEGVDMSAFAARTGFELERLGGQALAEFVDRSLLEMVGSRLRLTREGLYVSDSIWPYILRR
jgi:oxygen-independent coproporphyrinogen-3 oxidase